MKPGTPDWVYSSPTKPGIMKESSPNRLLDTLERLLMAPMGDMRATMAYAADLLAEATGSDKVDVFIHDPQRDSLITTGSNQPLSALQRKLGLNVLQVANGGRVIQVFKTGKTFVTGALDEDPEELKGIKEGLKIKSKIGVPLDVGGQRRGMIMLASLRRDFYTEEDVRFAESVERWVGTILHRAELSEQMTRNAQETGRRAVAEELVTVLAHDLRNYFAPLGLRLHLLRHRAEEQRRADDLADIDAASKALSRLTGLVEDMLDVARIDRGVFKVDQQPTPVDPLVNDIAGGLATPEQPIDVKIQSDTPLVVQGDPARLRQCLENLVANAVQKSPRGAPVRILVQNEQRKTGDWCRIEIIDEGPGIPEEMLPHIFDRFTTGRLREGGLGLGLYLARRIAVMHGGEIKVESEPGKGARFLLALPCIGAAR
jgi:two-component system OmpR family sensor kinase